MHHPMVFRLEQKKPKSSKIEKISESANSGELDGIEAAELMIVENDALLEMLDDQDKQVDQLIKESKTIGASKKDTKKLKMLKADIKRQRSLIQYHNKRIKRMLSLYYGYEKAENALNAVKRKIQTGEGTFGLEMLQGPQGGDQTFVIDENDMENLYNAQLLDYDNHFDHYRMVYLDDRNMKLVSTTTLEHVLDGIKRERIHGARIPNDLLKLENMEKRIEDELKRRHRG